MQIKHTILYKGKPTEIVMKEMLANENDAYVVQFTSQKTGKTDLVALWEKRLTRSIVSPTELQSVDVIRELTAKEKGLLEKMWLAINDALDEDFLDLQKASEDEK